MDQHIETIVVGGGQAGLSVGYHLKKRGRPFLILDERGRTGDNWRRHWDTLRLYSPARYDGLPGLRFPGPGRAFPTKDQVADYLEAYAARFELPVEHGVHVEALTGGDGRYVLDCGDRRFTADHVVVATGTFGTRAYVPPFASELDPAIAQLHSTDYHRPDQLTDGPVLVVGASHSGADIAIETAREHHTILCGRTNGQLPVPLESRRARAAFPVLWFLARHVLTMRTPIGRKLRPEIRTHGGPLLRVQADDLAAAGVERVTERVAGVRDGKPVLDGGRVLDVATVVWCTGFRQDFGWIRLPVLGDDGWPLEERGVVPSSPGLYFTGLAFQSAFSSMLVGGAGADAEYVARHLAAARPVRAARTPRPSVPGR
ncbi:flavin-containing monooxygenase [Jiangella alkaliphila]|uniref:Putative flavoprotein involved in K+ transport n=1 Tax=Jiangella alkaliphila TaxID=419479 RepID=A0A1H2M8M3_9ACTN|nr:NAD(P)-binding domain-containing protein [Jiangella alkaliphila]SDU88836.1 putative flavoprotein involved in K+ transport [Jiangella alkaliphila]